MTRHMIKATTGNAVHDEVDPLLRAVPSGLSADAMSRISRLNLSAVEQVLAELERAGEVGSESIVFRGAPAYRLAAPVRPVRGRVREAPDPPPRRAGARQGGPALRHGNGSLGVADLGCRPAGEEVGQARYHRSGLRAMVRRAKPGDKLVYARGTPAYEKQFDPALAGLADRLLELANCRVRRLFPVWAFARGTPSG